MTFIEPFCGVGGFRLGLERNGHKCVWANDIDKYACKIYRKHFGKKELYEGDIRAVEPRTIPEADLLCAGFPCQSFSVAGKQGGFKDPRGNLFFELCRIARAKRIKYLFLENVRGLMSDDGGRTFTTIKQSLYELGYDCQWQVCNSKNYGVPQNRKRVFVVGHLRGERRPQVFPIQNSIEKIQRERDGESAGCISTKNQSGQAQFDGGTTLITTALDANYHKGGLGRGQRTLVQIGTIGEDDEASRVYDPNGIARTIKDGGGMGAKTGLYCVGTKRGQDRDGQRIYSSKGLYSSLKGNTGEKDAVESCGQIRRLTPTECERLQGFPDGWTEGLSDTQRYKCLGNAVTVNVIEAIGARL